jgi:hypothetical protein
VRPRNDWSIWSHILGVHIAGERSTEGDRTVGDRHNGTMLLFEVEQALFPAEEDLSYSS